MILSSEPVANECFLIIGQGREEIPHVLKNTFSVGSSLESTPSANFWSTIFITVFGPRNVSSP
jgi:hypothetical protein